MKKSTATQREGIPRKKGSNQVPKVGLFFVVDRKPFVEGIPWTENPSVSGFRTYPVGHPEFWVRLQDLGAAPADIPYEAVPRGRVNYMDATGRFTLLADRCIIKSKTLVGEIMAALGLPKGTAVVRDLHYRCAVCMGKVPTRKQEKDDWDF
ncbi:MAG: hypothetical protein ABSE79_12375 [Terriglobia bacterium]|jgi:hypothetical protein